MSLEQFYADVGGSYPEVKKHLMNGSVILRFLMKFSEDKTFSALENSLANGNIEEAFRAAHTLKGLCLNLGFNDLYTPLSELTEILRAGKSDGAGELFEKVKEKYGTVINGIKNLD